MHIDKKASGYSIEQINNNIKYSRLFIISPMRVAWGGDSQIRVEVSLLQEAIKTPHQYYHLISGMDLPLKTQEEIYQFFLNHQGTSFVSLEKDHISNISKEFMPRINYYYFFQNIIGRNKGNIYSILSQLQKLHIRLQKKLNVCRTKRLNVDFYKGSNWFSITHEVAQYVVDQFKRNKRIYRHSFCADEIFLHTIVSNSPYLDSIEDDGLRLIDWQRGNPYTFREVDFDMLIHSGENRLFARKFDEKVDKIIIEKMYSFLKNKTLKKVAQD